jgi:PAS domain S-box-containing protein
VAAELRAMDRLQQRIVVQIDETHGDEEIRRLRSSINDLISIQALPAIWDGRESGSIVSTLLDVLVTTLQLDFAYVRLSDSINGSPVEFVQLAQLRAPPPQALEIGHALDRWLTNPSVNAPLVVPNPVGDGEVKIAPFRLGLMDEIGVLVASSRRSSFPTPTEILLLRMAANLTLAALQEARRLHEQKRAAEELERRVADRTAELTAANEALRESEKKYRTLFDSMDEGFCTIEVLFDENDKPIDYRFLEINPSFEKQTGIQEARGRRMREIAPQHEEHWFETYGRIALTGEPVRFENQAAQLHRWYDVYAFRVGEPGDRRVAILFKDITERKQAEAKLLRNEAYLSEAQRLSHTGSFGWRPSIGELHWSEETFRIFQIDPKKKPTVELVLQRVHPDDATLVKETIECASREGNDFDFEHRLLMPDGSVNHVRVVAHAERDGSGELEFVGAVMDVTVAKKAEADLRISAKVAQGLVAVRADVSAALSKPSPAREILQECAQAMVSHLDAAFARIWTLNHKEDLLELQASAGSYTRLDGKYSRVKVGSLKVGLIALEQKPHVTNDVLNDPRIGDKDWAQNCGFVSFAGYPLVVDNRTVGVMGMFARHALSDATVAALASVADTIAQGIQRKRKEEELRRTETYLSEGQRLSRTGSWAWSVKTRENLFWSREHYRIYGFDPDTDSGQYGVARERIHPADASAFDENLKQMMQEPIDFEIHYRIVLPGGEVKHIHTLGHPVLNNAEELVEYIGTTVDVTEHVKAKAALEEALSNIKKSEASLRTIIDTIPALAWSSEADGSVEFVNRRWSNYTGLTIEQARGSGWQAAIHPEDAGWLPDRRRINIASGKPFELEVRMRRYDGQYRWFINRANPLLDEQGKILKWYGTFTDIDDRKRAEEALRRSEAYLAEAQKLSHTGSWARNSATGQTGYWSEECRRLMGYEPHDAPPSFQTYLQRVHPDDQARVEEIVETAGREKVDYQVDYRLIHPGGEIRDIHTIGHPVFSPSGDLVEYVGTVIDVTERKRAEEALQARERELRLITESIPGMIVVNSPDGANEYTTQRLLNYLGKELADLKGLKWASIVHPDDAEAMVNKWLDSVRTGRPMEVIHRMRRTDGVYRWFQSRVEPLLNEQGRILRWYGLIIDVDAQKNATEALRKSQTELAHVSRLTTMGELTASIAHEVNQPLAAVVNNANACISLLAAGDPNGEEVREALTEIIEDAERASDVIARVRQLARKAPVERTTLDLRDVIADVLALARHESAARRVTIHTEIPREPPLVLGDRVQLQQVLLNLVVNGMDAMNAVEESKRVLMICGHCETRDGRLESLVSVQDAGSGFKPEQMNRLFEAFYTTKPQGMGMGLAISRSIIEAHGGRLWAEANQGRGATFLFSLPAAPEPLDKGGPAAGNAPS